MLVSTRDGTGLLIWGERHGLLGIWTPLRECLQGLQSRERSQARWPHPIQLDPIRAMKVMQAKDAH